MAAQQLAYGSSQGVRSKRFLNKSVLVGHGFVSVVDTATYKGLPLREYWQELVSQQEQSGLSVHAFCKQRDVTEASFYNWRKQLRNNTGVGFALVDG
jgi:hypothetical protein